MKSVYRHDFCSRPSQVKPTKQHDDGNSVGNVRNNKTAGRSDEKIHLKTLITQKKSPLRSVYQSDYRDYSDELKHFGYKGSISERAHSNGLQSANLGLLKMTLVNQKHKSVYQSDYCSKFDVNS